MKTAISVPDPLFDEADELAGRLGVSRSALYTQAIRDYLELHRSDLVTEKLNTVYSQESSELDPVIHRMQVESLPDDPW